MNALSHDVEEVASAQWQKQGAASACRLLVLTVCRPCLASRHPRAGSFPESSSPGVCRRPWHASDGFMLFSCTTRALSSDLSVTLSVAGARQESAGLAPTAGRGRGDGHSREPRGTGTGEEQQDKASAMMLQSPRPTADGSGISVPYCPRPVNEPGGARLRKRSMTWSHQYRKPPRCCDPMTVSTDCWVSSVDV